MMRAFAWWRGLSGVLGGLLVAGAASSSRCSSPARSSSRPSTSPTCAMGRPAKTTG